MNKKLVMKIIDKIIFTNLLAFRKEVTSPRAIKREIDLLLRRLGKISSVHTNKVITKVKDQDRIKNTMDMQIMLPLKTLSGIDSFIKTYDQYFLIKAYKINKSYSVSIPNDPLRFKQVIEQFLTLSTGDGRNNFDAGKRHMIEVARIDYYGNTLGFDLYMEIENQRRTNVKSK